MTTKLLVIRDWPGLLQTVFDRLPNLLLYVLALLLWRAASRWAGNAGHCDWSRDHLLSCKQGNDGQHDQKPKHSKNTSHVDSPDNCSVPA